MAGWPRRQQFWKHIRARAMANLFLAVFLTFSATGFLGDIVALDKQPFSTAIYNAVLSGLTAGCVLLGVARDYRWFVAAGAVQVLGGIFTTHYAVHQPWVAFTHLTNEQRLQIDSVAGLLVIISGYNAFIAFIGGEGRRQVAVTTELELAQRIHESLVPPLELALPGATVYGVSRPSGQVGGDLVDVIRVSDKEWIGYVADVSGHGVSSGLIMGMVKSAMRMGLVDGPSLTALVGRLNRHMCGQLTPGMYVTLGIVRCRLGEPLEVLIAGHPPLLLFPATGHNERIAAGHIPIGIDPGWVFTSNDVRLGRGDLAVLLTDGLFEVFDSKDRDLGIDAIAGTLEAVRDLPLDEVSSRVFARAKAFGAQLDDQTILLIRGT